MQPLTDVRLDVVPTTIAGFFEEFERLARGARVLNVGATGGVEQYLPDQRENWLHHRLGLAARDLVAIDIDQDSITYAARHGVQIKFADAQVFKSEQPFDLIVMSDVIEHLNAVVPTIANLAGLLTPGGTLVITTPNPTHFGVVLRSWLGGQASIFSDHTAAFMPEHIQVVANRLGLRLTKVSFFTHLDRRSGGMALKSLVSRAAGWLMPRSHGSVMVHVQRKTS